VSKPPQTKTQPKKVLFNWADPRPEQIVPLAKLLNETKELTERFQQYHADQYHELLSQRVAIRKQISDALLSACMPLPYSFNGWWRVIRHRYSDHLLSAYGSLVVGGRFNFGGDLEPLRYAPFSCFYLAADHKTALAEALGQDPAPGLSAFDAALAKGESIVSFRLRGEISRVLDLRQPTPLDAFAKLTRGFKYSGALRAKALRLPVSPPTVCKTAKEIRDAVLHRDWRQVPVLCHVPANSQILGHLAHNAGIGGILYPSKQTGLLCLAVFPQTFEQGGSHLELEDTPPASYVGPTRVDETNCEAASRSSTSMAKSVFSKPSN